MSFRRKLYRAPLVPVASSLAIGIAAGRFAPFPTGFWCVLGGAGLLVAFATLTRKHLRLGTSAAIAVTVLAIGAVHLRLAFYTADEDHIVTYAGESRILATLRGRVVTSPQIFEDPPDAAVCYRRPPRTTFLLRVDEIQSDRGGRRVKGLVRVTLQYPHERIAAGQSLQLVGWVGRFHPPRNPGGFDWARATRNDHVLAHMTVPAVEGVTILSGVDRRWYTRVLWHVRAAARQHLTSCADQQSGRLLNALIIGERHPALRSLSRTMVRAGIAHFLSISGLHLGVFLGFVYLLCRLSTLAPRRAAAVVLVILAAYLLLAEPRAPLLRSAIMAAALCLGVIFQRRNTAMNSLAAAGVILLVMDPLQLFKAGFQLSFAIVIGLILLRRPMRDLLFGRWLRRRGLMVFRDDQRRRRWTYYTLGNLFTELVATCLVAYIMAAPLVAYHFGLFNPYASLLSVLVFPIVLCVLVPGYVSLGLAWIMPNLSYTIGRIAGGAADVLGWAVNGIRHLPGASFELRPVGAVWVLLCYGVILLIAVHRRVRFGTVTAWGAAAILVAATGYTQRIAPPDQVAELNILSVGGGQCALLRTPSGETYIFDAGTREGFDAYEQVLAPFLRTRRLPAPAAAFISHANADHYNAVASVVRRQHPQRVYLNPYFGNEDDPLAPPSQLMHLFMEKGIKIVRVREGVRVALDDRTTVEVLWPPLQTREDLTVNDTSLVLRIVCDEQSVLLTGDIEGASQSALSSGTRPLASDALLIPHHGTWEDELPDFVAAVKPRVVMVSCGRDPRAPVERGHQGQQFYRNLQNAYRYYTTRRNGWIQLRFGGGKIEVHTMR